MASMFAKLQKSKEESKITYMRDITTLGDTRYFMVSRDGNLVAVGSLDDIKYQMGTEYSTTPIKYWRHDKITDTVKVVVM